AVHGRRWLRAQNAVNRIEDAPLEAVAAEPKSVHEFVRRRTRVGAGVLRARGRRAASFHIKRGRLAGRERRREAERAPETRPRHAGPVLKGRGIRRGWG